MGLINIMFKYALLHIGYVREQKKGYFLIRVIRVKVVPHFGHFKQIELLGRSQPHFLQTYTSSKHVKFTPSEKKGIIWVQAYNRLFVG